MLRMGLSQNHNQHNHSSESVPLLLDLLHIVCACMLSCFSRVWLFATPWTVAQQAPLSMEFSRQEYWSGLPFPSPVNLLDPGIKPASLALAGVFFTAEPAGEQYTSLKKRIKRRTTILLISKMWQNWPKIHIDKAIFLLHMLWSKYSINSNFLILIQHPITTL